MVYDFLLGGTPPIVIYHLISSDTYMGLSENSVPLNPMVLLIIIPFLNG